MGEKKVPPLAPVGAASMPNFHRCYTWF